ncbi:MAG: hypothetical protein IT453_14395 [Planctomycetes bacterium]|nr:hypothetical protein [Planctomycetota bacterium]
MTPGRSARWVLAGLAYAWPAAVVALGLASDYWRWNEDGRYAEWFKALGTSAVALPAITLAWLAVLGPRTWPQRVVRLVILWTILGLELVLVAFVLMASTGGV